MKEVDTFIVTGPVLFLTFVVVFVVIIWGIMPGLNPGTLITTQQGTIISQKDAGEGVHVFGVCVSVPNCGLRTEVRLANGSLISYIDTCYWNTGNMMNFSYYSKNGWRQDVVMCD
jgi:hypothetical protein